jgi:tetratricopeptide (TPR) repeat protein
MQHQRTLRWYLLLFTLLTPIVSCALGILFFPPGRPTPADVARHAVQAAIITFGTILPISMYYFFVQTRHPIILKEFQNNLKRLGMQYRDFEDRFDAVYGGGKNLMRTAAPVILATVIILVGWWMVFYPPSESQPLESTQPATAEALEEDAQGEPSTQSDAPEPLHRPFVAPNLTPVVFGFLGAYTMVIGSLGRRYLTDDLKPKAFTTVVWDVLLMWSIIWTLSQLEGPFASSSEWAPPVYFVLGLIPEAGLDLIKAIASAALRIRLRSYNEYPLTRIQGLDRWNSKRLMEEGIENVQHLATADIIELLLRTRFPPERIVDWIDQALLQIHLKPKRKDQEKKKEQPAQAPASAPKPAPGATEWDPAPSTPSIPEPAQAQAPGVWERYAAAYQEVAGLNLADPIEKFLEANVRTATDLLYIHDYAPQDSPKLEALANLVNPVFGLHFLVAALRQDPNIVHIRHWRENEGLVIAETAEKTLGRAKESLEEAQKARLETEARTSYRRAAEEFSRALKFHRGEDVSIEALMGRAQANTRLAELVSKGPKEKERKADKLKQALDDYNQVIEHDIEGNLALEARLERARLIIENEFYDEEMRETVDIESDLRAALDVEEYQKADNYLLLYERLEGTLDFTGQRKALAQALSKVPENDAITRANLLLLRAQIDGVEPDYREALALAPDNPEIYKGLGSLYMETEQFDQAAGLHKQWTDRLRDSSEWKGFAYYKLGEAYRAQEKSVPPGEQRWAYYRQAASAYEESQRCPIDIAIFQRVEALNPLAECYEVLGKYDKLIRLARTGQPLDLARAYRKAGRLEQARQQLRAARAAGEKRVYWRDEERVHLELAMIEARAGNPDEATRKLITALLQRQLPKARALIEEVERDLVISQIERAAEPDEAVQAWVNESKAGFQGVEDALMEAFHLLQDEEEDKAYRTFIQAVETLAQACSPTIQESHVRISTRDRRDCYEQLSRIETAKSVNPWALYGLAVAKARAHRVRERIVDALGTICGVATIDDLTLEVMLDPERARDPEDEYWNSNWYVSTYVQHAAEMLGFHGISSAGQDDSPDMVTMWLEDGTRWEDGSPQTAQELGDALLTLQSGGSWSHVSPEPSPS